MLKAKARDLSSDARYHDRSPLRTMVKKYRYPEKYVGRRRATFNFNGYGILRARRPAHAAASSSFC